MTYFRSKHHRSILVTNYKVMFSTLTHQANLVPIRKRQSLAILTAKDFYLLVRNPFTRIESFFRDKLRNSVPNDYAKGQWQDSQKIFFDSLGLTESSDERRQEKLLATSFQDFLAFLPEVYLKDGHLQPQHKLLKYRIGAWNIRVPIKLKFQRFFKMECPDDLDDLTELFDLDLKKKTNSTGAVKEDLSWTRQGLDIIRELYATDFELFNYSFDDARKHECG